MRALDQSSFAALTVDSIAREAGITRPVIYDHFGDLAGLLAAFLEEAEQKALAAVSTALSQPSFEVPLDELITTAMRAFLEAVRAEPGVWRIVLLPPEGTPSSARGRVEKRRAELAAVVADILELLSPQHQVLRDVDSPTLARILIAVAEDMGRLVLERPRRFTPTRMARTAGQIVSLVTTNPAPADGQA